MWTMEIRDCSRKTNKTGKVGRNVKEKDSGHMRAEDTERRRCMAIKVNPVLDEETVVG